MSRDYLKKKKRIVVKVGSSSLMHPETQRLDLVRTETLVRELVDLRNSGHQPILVTSGAIAVGRNALHLTERPSRIDEKQACASIGQARLIMIYQKLFLEYNQLSGQILLTKGNMLNPIGRTNARNTFEELLRMNVIPVVNENDSVAVSEIEQLPNFGDNDTLSAVIAALTDADLLILLSDIDGFYTDDPHRNPHARLISEVSELDEKLFSMGGSEPGSSRGTGGMHTKLLAAQIAVDSGIDMVIANGNDFHNIHRVINGEEIGTIFHGKRRPDFDLVSYLDSEDQQK